MVWFATDELISSTKLVRNFGSVLDKLKNKEISKVWVLKNNNLEWVFLSRETYDKLIEYIEDFEDLLLVKERLENDNWTRISYEEMAKKHNIDLNNL